MIGLMDADGLVYRLCSACSVDVLWHDGLITPYVTHSLVVDELEKAVAKIVRDTKIKKLVFYFSGPVGHNFRRTMITESYKEQRTGSRPPAWDHCIDWLVDQGHEVVQRQIFEADDLVGAAYGYEEEALEGEVVRISSDKDMRTVPGHLYNDHKATMEYVSPEEANYHWLFQVLVGDASDGYKGCPKVGKVTAPPIARKGWGAVVQAYEKAGLTQADAIQAGQLARILRPGEIQEDQPCLWTP